MSKSKKFRNPGYGKNSFPIRIQDPGGKKALDPGSGSAALRPGIYPAVYLAK
jgi:hypothetical protein